MPSDNLDPPDGPCTICGAIDVWDCDCYDDEPVSCTCSACSCMSRDRLDAIGTCYDCRRGVHEEYDEY